jgi:alpha-L-fucosidase 2
VTAGIAEMLMQSHTGVIELLPALPSAWQEGSVKGLCGRGGFEVSFNWAEGVLQGGEIISTLGGDCRIKVPGKQRLQRSLRVSCDGGPVELTLVSNPETANRLGDKGVWRFMTEPGRTYSVHYG